MRSLYGAIANTNKKEIMVSVDAVYQKVLAIANKEQRGYITPQEFNLFADHAQKDIFRQYFYDLEQFERRAGSDIVGLINHKIQSFESGNIVVSHGSTLPLDTYKIDDAYIDLPGEERTILQRINRDEVMSIKAAPFLRNSLAPSYYVYNNTFYTTASNPPINSTYNVILTRNPIPPNWTYVIVGESAMFDDLVPGFQDFELHSSEEALLVIKILQLAGINIKDPALVQIASQEEMKKTQQEKQ
jgi:hypothetical protein